MERPSGLHAVAARLPTGVLRGFPLGCRLLAVLLWCGGCAPADEEEERAVEPPVDEEGLVEPAHPLVGTWKTRGVDPVLGEVVVLMELQADGRLRLVLVLNGGGRRSFPGVWEVQDDTLVLKGEYFGPAGERRVKWMLEEEGKLVLEEEGSRQEWERQDE